MLLEPPIDKLVKKVGNPYKLAVLAGKRAKYLQRTLTEEELNAIPEVTRAVHEIYEGTVIAEEDNVQNNITTE
ncbi:MAG: DNA-directed RNA polymerase subunit omega [Clostridiales bacterium]|nr:DNA-directed RNA polymerase subunit omega [Clostridiales bacterium]